MPVLFDIPLRVGDAEIGNWNIATHRNNNPVRNLNGCMDEFLLFSRALGGPEVDPANDASIAVTESVPTRKPVLLIHQLPSGWMKA